MLQLGQVTGAWEEDEGEGGDRGEGGGWGTEGGKSLQAGPLIERERDRVCKRKAGPAIVLFFIPELDCLYSLDGNLLVYMLVEMPGCNLRSLH